MSRPENTAEVFWSRVEPEPNTGCWFWIGRRHRTGTGYGRFNYRGARVFPHRLAYELVKGPIPEGMTIDHRCRQQSCVNPDHLRPMTLAENQRLGGQYIKTHCPRGHALDGVTHRGDGRSFRYCRTCDNARKKRVSFTKPEGA